MAKLNKRMIRRMTRAYDRFVFDILVREIVKGSPNATVESYGYGVDGHSKYNGCFVMKQVIENGNSTVRVIANIFTDEITYEFYNHITNTQETHCEQCGSHEQVITSLLYECVYDIEECNKIILRTYRRLFKH
mgnify:CR=1 FL=1